MTADVVIAGSGGFIGGWLTSMLADRGVASVDVREFATGSDTAKLLVNLATVHSDPNAGLELLNERVDQLGDRVDHWLQTQSFITLHGRGELRLDRFNAGFSPLALDLYGVGKMVEERGLLEAERSGRVGSLTFAYLPAVLDEGGGWARVRAQALRCGYLLPPRMSPSARANFVYISDLADLVVARLSSGDLPPVSRLIVNDPLSRTTTWPDLLGPNRLSPGHAGRAAALKRAAREAKVMAGAWRLGATMSIDRLGLPAGEAAPEGPAENGEPVTPVEFTGVMRALVMRQGFLPPTPYA